MSEVGDTTTNVEDIGESKDTSESNEENQTVNADAVDDLIKKETHLRVLKESQKNKKRAVTEVFKIRASPSIHWDDACHRSGSVILWIPVQMGLSCHIHKRIHDPRAVAQVPCSDVPRIC